MSAPKPVSTVKLCFQGARALRHVEAPIRADLSAATCCGNNLFLCSDETAGIDRLTATTDGWGAHVHFPLGEMIALPAGPADEMDIEGLHCDGSWLWIVGSHSLKRKKPDQGDDPQDALAAMGRIKRDPNRFFLGRFPLIERDGGMAPVARDGDRAAQHVTLRKKRSKLREWLRKDPHLAPFLDIPSKENGLDIEGIVAEGMRVWLGLRGPVLRGWAVVLEMEMKVTGGGHLKPRRIDGKRRYRKHLLPCHGQGIRDLAFDDHDMLILTGPTMSGDGPCEVLRWKGARQYRDSATHPDARVEHVTELPYCGPRDHPEGLTALPDGGWLVVHDSPAERRLDPDGTGVTADIWSFG